MEWNQTTLYQSIKRAPDTHTHTHKQDIEWEKDKGWTKRLFWSKKKNRKVMKKKKFFHTWHLEKCTPNGSQSRWKNF